MLTCRLKRSVEDHGHYGQGGVVEPKAAFGGLRSMETRLMHVWYSLACQCQCSNEKCIDCVSECLGVY